MRYPDYNTQSVWKRINQMLAEHMIENPHHCNKHNRALCTELFNESTYQKWLKKPIHTFGTERAFELFTEAVDRAVDLIQSRNDGIDYNAVMTKHDLDYNPADLCESYDFFSEGVVDEDFDNTDDYLLVKKEKPSVHPISDEAFDCIELEEFDEDELEPPASGSFL